MKNKIMDEFLHLKFNIPILVALIPFFVVLFSNTASAVPLTGQAFPVKLPDGKAVSVRFFGSEYYVRMESPDGYTLIKSSDGWLYYAELNSDSTDFMSTGIRYLPIPKSKSSFAVHPALGKINKNLKLNKNGIIQKIEEQNPGPGNSQGNTPYFPASDVSYNTETASPAQVPHTGDLIGVAMLIEFPDEPATYAPYEIDNLLNQIGYERFGNNGSVRDYFYDVSGGRLDYTIETTDYYRADHPKQYYIDRGADGRTLLIQETLRHFMNQGYDFSNLTLDEQGYIEGLNFLYTGDMEAGTCLHPRNSAISTMQVGDNIFVHSYMISDIGTDRMIIGTFAHESGHLVFDWLDICDLNGGSNGVGDYCLMGWGSWLDDGRNPMVPNPYFRMLAGWENVIEITSERSGTQFIHDANALTTYRYSHPAGASEFFLIESRIRAERNLSIHDEGLIIWHIDQNGNNIHEQMTPEKHYMVSVEQADGQFHLEHEINYGDDRDFFHAGDVAVFNDMTLPSAKWWNGDNSGLRISNISSAGRQMSFTAEYAGMSSIQAEDGAYCSWISGTSIDDDHEGFTGEGYVNTPNKNGAWTECRVTVPKSGKYQITVRYANGKKSTRSAQCIVNGTHILNAEFYYTGGWAEWSEKYFMGIPLQAGSNTFRLAATTSGGLPNIDRYDVPEAEEEYYSLSLRTNGNGTIQNSPSGNTFPYLTPITLTATPDEGYEFTGWDGDLHGTENPVTIELDCDQIIIANFALSESGSIQAENGSYCSWISGTSIDDDHQGFTGEGYVNTPNKTGAWTECKFTVPKSGKYQITVRYANGNKNNRGAQFIVNGNHLLNADFYHTGGWAEWSEKYFMGIPLQAGSNTFRLAATTSGGLPNIDRYDVPETEEEYYNLSLRTNGNGTIQNSPSGNTFPYLTPITLTATPDEGYEFTGWDGDLHGTQNPVTIELDCDQIIIANFGLSESGSIQAENRAYCSWISGTSIDDDHRGFTGEGYVNTPNKTGAWTECEVTVPKSGNYQITVTYANGKSSTRKAQCIVNGTHLLDADFYYTGGWAEWSEKYFMGIPLQAGKNTFRLTATTSGGLPNIDRYDIQK